MGVYDWILVIAGIVSLALGAVLLSAGLRERPSPWYGRLSSGALKGFQPLIMGPSCVVVGLSLLLRRWTGGT